jgi:hypothetical protein
MSRSIPQVNYIRHLENFLAIVNAGDMIHFGHVSLYVSLFRIWNLNYFINPFCPSRNEIMSHAGIRSKDAFYRNLKELDAMDLIRYYPSKSRYEHSYFCISTIEQSEAGFKVDVWGLTNHNSVNNGMQTKLDFQETSTPTPNKVVDINTKLKLFNAKGVLVLEKTLSIDHNGKKESIDLIASFDPHSDPRYASQIDNRISSLSNNSNYANHQNSQSGRTGLHPPGVQIDPDADYSIPL